MTRKDHRLIKQIAARAADLYCNKHGLLIDWRWIAAELTIVHDEVIRLRLDDMLAGPDLDFAHDIGGIHKHLVIGKPSKLSDCFCPRYAQVSR